MYGKIRVNLELNRRPKKNGLHTIFILISKGKKHKRIHSRIEVLFNQYNKKAKYGSWIRANMHSDYLNTQLIEKLHEIRKKIDESVKAGIDPTLEYIVSELTNTKLNFFEFCAEYFKRPKLAKQTTINRYKATILKFQNFLDREIDVKEIDIKMILAFESHMHEKGNKINTIEGNMRVISSMYNAAALDSSEKDRIYLKARNPFELYTFKKQKVLQVALTMDEFKLIENAKLIGELNDARNIFCFMFYMGGIRISDALQMKYSMVTNGTLKYTQVKGENIKPVHRRVDLLPIHYKFLTYKGDYFFPYSSNGKTKDRNTGHISRKLKKVCAQLGIDKNVTTKTARHTFGAWAKPIIGMDQLRDVYGHSSTAMTANYTANSKDLLSETLSSLFKKKRI